SHTMLVWHSHRGPRHAMFFRVVGWRRPRLRLFPMSVHFGHIRFWCILYAGSSFPFKALPRLNPFLLGRSVRLRHFMFRLELSRWGPRHAMLFRVVGWRCSRLRLRLRNFFSCAGLSFDCLGLRLSFALGDRFLRFSMHLSAFRWGFTLHR